MSDPAEENVNDTSTPQEVEYTETEQEAMSIGWNPDGAEGKPNLSAEEFIARKPLYDSMHDMKRQIKKMEEKNTSFQTHHLEVLRRLNESKEQELQAAKNAALDDMDIDAVKRVDKQLDDHRASAKKDEAALIDESVAKSNPSQAAFDAWVKDNNWYFTDPVMAGYANDMATQIGNSGMYNADNYDEFYTAVEKEVRTKYKDRFQNDRRQAPSAVEGDTSRGKQGRGKATKTIRDLDPETQGLVRNMVQSTDMTEKEYIAELEKSGYFN